jgi:excisionase family DNA binding protein
MKDGQRETGEKMEPLLVRVEEAARILGLGRSTVYELMDRGELRFVKYGAARRVPLAALRAWVEQHTQPVADSEE